jgi:hypothetical protein
MKLSSKGKSGTSRRLCALSKTGCGCLDVAQPLLTDMNWAEDLLGLSGPIIPVPRRRLLTRAQESLKQGYSGRPRMPMHRPMIRSVLVVLLIAALMAPLVEAFDSWDKAGLINDSEFQVATLAMAAGLFSVVAILAIKAHRALSPHVELCPQEEDRSFIGAAPFLVFHGCSPPGVPLRI